MTDEAKTPKRKPAGAALAGYHNRPVNYPRQLVITTTDAQADWIEARAEATEASKSEVARALIGLGIAYYDRIKP